jgi:quinol monooxygenase YgiN
MLGVILCSAPAYTVPHAVAMQLPRRSASPTMQYKVQAETRKLFGDAKPYTFLTIQPTFTVQDWTRAKPIMEDFVTRTRKEANCMYYGWSKTGDKPGDKLFCREAYTDAAAVLEHIENIGPCVDALLAEGVATLDEISLHGPSAELDKCKETCDPFGMQYYQIDSGFSTITKEVGGIPSGQRLVSIQPTFTVQSWEKAKPIMAEFVEKTSKEGDVIFYGWTTNGDKLFCREAYSSGKGVLRHLENVGPCVEALLADGVATLDRIELHGPMGQVQECKQAMDAFGTTYFNVDSGFQRYECIKLGGFMSK